MRIGQPVNFAPNMLNYIFDRLEKVIEEFGMEPGVVIDDPMEGLIKYYANTGI